MAQKLPIISHHKKRAFLAAFAETGNIRASAETAGIDRRSHTNWRREDKDYAKAFAAARNDAADTLEQEARRRAKEGVKKPMVRNGALVMVPADLTKPFDEKTNPLVPVFEHEYSDTLLIFLLKAVRPKKFRENVKVSHGTRRMRVTVKHTFSYENFARELESVRRERDAASRRALPAHDN